MAKNSSYSQIKTYSELETTLRMIKIQSERSKQQQQQQQPKMLSLKAGTSSALNWVDLGLVLLRGVKMLLTNKE